MLSSDFNCKKNDRTTGAAHLTQTLFGEKPDSCGSPGPLFSWYQEISPKVFSTFRRQLCAVSSGVVLPVFFNTAVGRKGEDRGTGLQSTGQEDLSKLDHGYQARKIIIENAGRKSLNKSNKGLYHDTI